MQHIACFCQTHGVNAELRQDGTLYTATSQAQIGSMEPVMQALEACDINSYRTLLPEDVVRRSGSARNLAGVYSPIATTVHPGKLVRGLFSWRGRIAPVFDQRSPYEGELTQALRSYFPALGLVPITASWNGPSDRPVTGFPFFGKLNGAAHIYYGFGYSGNGVGPTYMGGQILSSMLLGLDNVWTRSPPDAWPFGVLSAGAIPVSRINHGSQCHSSQRVRRRRQPPALAG